MNTALHRGNFRDHLQVRTEIGNDVNIFIFYQLLPLDSMMKAERLVSTHLSATKIR
jgi:hypothetical protein